VSPYSEKARTVIKRQTEPNQLSAILALAPYAVVHMAPFRLLPVLVADPRILIRRSLEF
jgi:hypothetical protein